MKGWKDPSKYGKENALGGPLCSTAGEDSRRERGLGSGGVLRPGTKGGREAGTEAAGREEGRAGQGELGAPLPPSRRPPAPGAEAAEPDPGGSLPAFLPPPPPLPRPEARSLPSLSPSPRRPHPRLPARGAEARMALTPNLRKVESPPGEAEAGGGQPLLEAAGLPSSGVAASVRAAGGDMLGAGALRGGKAEGRPIRIRSSTRNPEWPEKADCSDCGKVRVGVGRSRLGYTAGGAMRLGNIIAGAARPPSRPSACLPVCLSVCVPSCQDPAGEPGRVLCALPPGCGVL